MGDQQRCCLLGICCPPGSAAQRQALADWLVSKLAAGLAVEDVSIRERVNGWLDELPWEKASDG